MLFANLLRAPALETLHFQSWDVDDEELDDTGVLLVSVGKAFPSVTTLSLCEITLRSSPSPASIFRALFDALPSVKNLITDDYRAVQALLPLRLSATSPNLTLQMLDRLQLRGSGLLYKAHSSPLKESLLQIARLISGLDDEVHTSDGSKSSGGFSSNHEPRADVLNDSFSGTGSHASAERDSIVAEVGDEDESINVATFATTSRHP